MKASWILRWAVLGILSCGPAQAGVPVPRELGPIIENLILHTDEGFQFAARVLGRSFVSVADREALMSRLAEDGMESLSQELSARLRKLEGIIPARSSNWILAYRDFARNELALREPWRSDGKVEFLPATAEENAYQRAADRFLAGRDISEIRIAGEPALTTDVVERANLQLNAMEGLAAHETRELQALLTNIPKPTSDLLNNPAREQWAREVSLKLEQLARYLAAAASVVNTPGQQIRLMEAVTRVGRMLERDNPGILGMLGFYGELEVVVRVSRADGLLRQTYEKLRELRFGGATGER